MQRADEYDGRRIVAHGAQSRRRGPSRHPPKRGAHRLRRVIPSKRHQTPRNGRSSQTRRPCASPRRIGVPHLLTARTERHATTTGFPEDTGAPIGTNGARLRARLGPPAPNRQQIGGQRPRSRPQLRKHGGTGVAPPSRRARRWRVPPPPTDRLGGRCAPAPVGRRR